MKLIVSWRTLSGGEHGGVQSKPLEGDGPFFVGRSRDNFIHLNDLRVSRRHLSFQPRGSQLLVSDYGSANGAFLDGQAFKSAVWSPGQKIQVADYELTLTATAGERVDAPSPKPRDASGDGAALAQRRASIDAAGLVGKRAEPEPVLDAQMAALAAAQAGVRADAVGGSSRRVRGQKDQGGRRPTEPSRRGLTPFVALGPVTWLFEAFALLTIVVSSVVMTANVIVLSVSSKTADVEKKAKEVLSIFGIDLPDRGNSNEEAGADQSDPLDPWAFAWDLEEYQTLIAASFVVYAIALVLLIAWHALAHRAFPFGFGSSTATRILASPVVWLVPGVNLVFTPLAIVKLYDMTLNVDEVGMGAKRARVLVLGWWLALILGAGLIAWSLIDPPVALDASDAFTIVAGPLLVILAAALAVVFSRDITHRIIRSAQGG